MLLPYRAKISPILMIIQLYDTLLSMNIIKYIVNFCIVESLRLVTDQWCLKFISIFILSLLIRFVINNSALFILLTDNKDHKHKTYLTTYLFHKFKSTLHQV